MEFWSSRTLEKIRVPNAPANDEFTLLRLRSSRNTPFSSHWRLTIPPSFWPVGDRQVKQVDLLLLTAATLIGGMIITASNNNYNPHVIDAGCTIEVWHGHAVAVRTSNTVIRNHDELT